MIMNTARKGSAEQEMIHVLSKGDAIYADSSGLLHRIPSNTDFDMPKGIVLISCDGFSTVVTCDDYTFFDRIGSFAVFSLRADTYVDLLEGGGGNAN